ncbi:MAG: M23 family metallopeptidase [Patescibacteria group bacterium]|nr:M23 family metallopeptidase [Patescibacteria group bacterium]
MGKKESQKFFVELSEAFVATSKFVNDTFSDLGFFVFHFTAYILEHVRLSFLGFEKRKSDFAAFLYKQRGRAAKQFVHTSMVAISAFGIVIAPVVAQEFPNDVIDSSELPTSSYVLSYSNADLEISTEKSDKVRDKILDYIVNEGDTLSSIADKFGVSLETILWQNNLTKTSKIKPGQIIQVLPVTGVAHKVQKGDTVYSIAKKYDTEPQSIVDFPFNTFSNDETFEIAVGQLIIVPDGVKPEEKPSAPRVRQTTPNAGTVVASGMFVWPANGTITQGYSWYHKGIDIANRAAPDVLASDSGTVIVAGWPDNYGYGNRVIIDHGNGYKTLYAHLQKIYVTAGQTVARGNAIGKMGSTGRSTGTHLHFEIIKSNGHLSPLTVLK